MDPYHLGTIILLSQGETRPGLSHDPHWGRPNGLSLYADGKVRYGLTMYESMQTSLGQERTAGIQVGQKRWH